MKPASPRGSPSGRALLVCGLALVAVCCFFHRAAFTDATFVARDNLRVYLPLHHFWARQVMRGHFPGWYPYDGLGQPFVGMFVGSAFHPLNLLYLVLPLGAALKWNMLLAYLAAGLGVWGLSRDLKLAPAACALSAAVFTFCGYSVCISNNLPYLMAAAALPWAWWALRVYLRAPSPLTLLGAGLSLAMPALAGDPQLFLMASWGALMVTASSSGLSGNGWAVGGSRLARLMSVWVLAGLFGALQLLPSLRMGDQAWVSANTTASALAWSGHPLRLLEALVGPLFLNGHGDALASRQVGQLLDPSFQSGWVDSQHFGVGPLLLAGAALFVKVSRRVKVSFLASLTLVGLLWLGSRGLLYGFLHEHFFLWHACRYPEKLTPLLVLLLAVAAGMGAQALGADGIFSRRFSRVALAMAALLILSAALESRFGLFSVRLLGYASFIPAEQRGRLGESFIRGALMSALIALGFGLVSRRWPGEPACVPLMAVLCFVHLFVMGEHLYLVASPEILERSSPFLEPLLADAGGRPAFGQFRVVTRVNGPSIQAPPGISAANYYAGFESAVMAPDIGELFNVEFANAYLPAANRRVLLAVHPLTNGALFNISFLIVGKEGLAAAGRTMRDARLRLHSVEALLLPTEAPLPRAYLAAALCVPSEEEAQRRVREKSFQAGAQAVVECGATAPAPDATRVTSNRGALTLLRYEPDSVELEVEAQVASLLVLNDAFYDGWGATVDDVEVAIHPTNGAVRGIFVPSGTHHIHFRYVSPGLREGLCLAGAGLLALVMWAFGRAVITRLSLAD